MEFADRVNAKSFDGDCVNCTSLHRGRDSRAINKDKDQHLEEKEVLSRNLEKVYILAKEGTKSNLIQEIKPYGNLWLLDGSIALKKAKILAEYFVFSSREDAETKLQESKDQVEYEQKALSQFYELKADLQTAAELGCCLHSRAADLAAEAQGQRGLVATDLLVHLYSLLNQADL